MKKNLISLLILPFILLLISCPIGDVGDINDQDDDTEIIDIPLLATPQKFWILLMNLMMI